MNNSLLLCFKIFVTLLFLHSSILSQKLDKKLELNALPFELQTVNKAVNIEVKDNAVLKITSAKGTNLFNNPNPNWGKTVNAPMVLFHPDSNFVFKAKIKAELKEIYDVAALVIYHNKDLWGKLCYENSANKESLVVSVITKNLSDDCNSFRLKNNYVYYAIAKLGNEFSYHYSEDNKNWEMVRHFNMEFPDDNYLIGFTAHAYVSDIFSAEFSEIKYIDKSLENMRSYNEEIFDEK